MSEQELILNKEELEAMHLHSEAFYLIEYDVCSRKKIPKNISKEEKEDLEQYNKRAEAIRNKLFFSLKFRIMATKHLESAWLISKDRLPNADKELEAIKAEMKGYGFDNVDKRIRVVPILTTEEGAENFEDMKVQFLLQFLTEHIQYCDDALNEQRMPKSSLWRCKKAYEIVNLLAEELKTEDSKHEVRDTAEILSDKYSQVEAMLEKQEEEEKANKAS